MDDQTPPTPTPGARVHVRVVAWLEVVAGALFAFAALGAFFDTFVSAHFGSFDPLLLGYTVSIGGVAAVYIASAAFLFRWRRVGLGLALGSSAATAFLFLTDNASLRSWLVAAAVACYKAWALGRPAGKRSLH